MNSKEIIAKGIEVVVFFFAAFSHFLLNIAPPDEVGVSFPVGISSLTALCIFVFIGRLANKNLTSRKNKKKWFVASGILMFLAIVFSLVYLNTYNKYTFHYPSSNPQNRYMGGTEFSREALNYMDSIKESDISRIVEDFGGLTHRTDIWSPSSIRKSTLLITINYIILIICFAGSLFSLTEGIVTKKEIS